MSSFDAGDLGPEVDVNPQLIRAAGVLVVRAAPSPHSPSLRGARVSEVLLMRHKRRWDLPKGHLDPGEDEHTAALRELTEETGLPVDAIELDPDFEFRVRYVVRERQYNREPRPKRVTIQLARLVREAPVRASHEHAGHEWVAWAPPHQIQKATIDPLLAAVSEHVGREPAAESQ